MDTEIVWTGVFSFQLSPQKVNIIPHTNVSEDTKIVYEKMINLTWRDWLELSPRETTKPVHHTVMAFICEQQLR